MATMPTTPDIKDFLRNEKPTEDDGLYGLALDAAKQTINDECQREFVVAGVAAARTFVPNECSLVLYIGDNTGVGIIVVENGTTLTSGTDYQLEPVNTVNTAGLSVPYNSLRRLDSYWYTNAGRGTVVVTTPWGWTSLPVRITEAIKIITKDIIENRDARAGLINLGEAGLASARTNPVVRATIEKYRGPASWGIA